MASEGISLNKYISSTGFCSRREADKLIEQARVTINNELVLPSAKVHAGDKVAIDGEPLKASARKAIYIAFNKPVGVTSTTDLKDRTNIISFINHPKRIFPIGRLDKDSDGLIFLTNDGDIVNKILRASNHHEKEYIVTVDKALTPDFGAKMSNGIPMLGTITNKCFVKQEGGRRFRIILTQGLNRQIRRMCEYLGYKVMTLTRVRIMNVQLANLPVGKWRYLTPEENDRITQLLASSEKTHRPTAEENRTPRVRKPKAEAKETSIPRPSATDKKAQRTHGPEPTKEASRPYRSSTTERNTSRINGPAPKETSRSNRPAAGKNTPMSNRPAATKEVSRSNRPVTAGKKASKSNRPAVATKDTSRSNKPVAAGKKASVSHKPEAKKNFKPQPDKHKRK